MLHRSQKLVRPGTHQLEKNPMLYPEFTHWTLTNSKIKSTLIHASTSINFGNIALDLRKVTNLV